MIYPPAYGITNDYPLAEKLFQFAMEKPHRVFEGYNGVYFYHHYGNAEFIVNTKKNPDNTEFGIDFCSFSTHMIYPRMYTMRVEEKVKDEKMEVVCLCSSMEGRSVTIPVNFTMADVLPSYQPGDLITFQGVGFLILGNFDIYESRDEAEQRYGFKPMKLMGNDLHLDDGCIFPGDGVKSEANVIFAKINGFESFPGVPYADGTGNMPMYAIDVNCAIGDIILVVPPEYISKHEGLLEKLESGAELYVSGMFYFSGDVAEREYNDGRILDEEHLLRFFRACKTDGFFDRLAPYIAEDCEYFGYKRTLRGRDEIIKWMSHVHDECAKNPKDVQIDYLATVTKVIEPDAAIYDVGKRLIVSKQNGSDGFMAVCFIELNDKQQINVIRFIYRNIYEFKVDEIPLTAEEKQFANLRPVKLERSPDEWKSFFLDWMNGKEIDKVAFFGGMEPEAVAVVDGKTFNGKEDVFVRIRDYLDGMASIRNCDYRLEDINMAIAVSDRKRITKIEIVG